MPARLKLFLPLIIFVVLALFLFRALSLDPTELPSALIDRPFPQFELTALATGEPISNADFDDVVRLYNVWATWCISCRVEHPYLQTLADQGVNIVGVNYKDDASAARHWLQQLGDPYSVNIVDDQGRLGLDLGVYGAPETFFVDAQGVIRYRHVGVIDERIWTQKLEPIYQQLLRQQQAGGE